MFYLFLLMIFTILISMWCKKKRLSIAEQDYELNDDVEVINPRANVN